MTNDNIAKHPKVSPCWEPLQAAFYAGLDFSANDEVALKMPLP